MFENYNNDSALFRTSLFFLQTHKARQILNANAVTSTTRLFNHKNALQPSFQMLKIINKSSFTWTKFATIKPAKMLATATALALASSSYEILSTQPIGSKATLSLLWSFSKAFSSPNFVSVNTTSYSIVIVDLYFFFLY